MTMSDNVNKTRAGAFAENARTIGYALLIALLIRAFLFQPFNIPSGSMIPTLLIGDYLFVSKYSYGYSRHSLPFSPPLFDGRVFAREPHRGDVVVFKVPTDNRTDFIKRLIGLPGDSIQMKHGVLYLNGEAVRRERVEDFVERDEYGNVRRIPQYRETLPNGVSYATLDLIDESATDNTGVYVVPPGHYFMMGDNRDNSNDSRVQSVVGYVPAENLVGRAEVIFFSTDGSARFWEVWRWPSSIRWQRMFTWVG
jgi:signal peptidase I